MSRVQGGVGSRIWDPAFRALGFVGVLLSTVVGV